MTDHQLTIRAHQDSMTGTTVPHAQAMLYTRFAGRVQGMAEIVNHPRLTSLVADFQAAEQIIERRQNEAT